MSSLEDSVGRAIRTPSREASLEVIDLGKDIRMYLCG